MELRIKKMNLSLYTTIMIAGQIVCQLAFCLLACVAVSGWQMNWGLLFLGMIISLLPGIYQLYVGTVAIADYNTI